MMMCLFTLNGRDLTVNFLRGHRAEFCLGERCRRCVVGAV